MLNQSYSILYTLLILQTGTINMKQCLWSDMQSSYLCIDWWINLLKENVWPALDIILCVEWPQFLLENKKHINQCLSHCSWYHKKDNSASISMSFNWVIPFDIYFYYILKANRERITCKEKKRIQLIIKITCNKGIANNYATIITLKHKTVRIVYLFF